jgi:hypothetical protein
VKPEETLVEARSGTDVQIVRQMCLKGRKTNRTIVMAGSLRSFPQDSGDFIAVRSGKAND